MKKTVIGLGALMLVLVSAGSALAYRGNPSVEGPNYSAERHEDMEKAFESNNYEAWKSLMQNRGRVTQLATKENFSKFAEAHELMEDGKIEEAKKIREEIGLGLGNGSGKNRGGMMNGTGGGRNCNR